MMIMFEGLQADAELARRPQSDTINVPRDAELSLLPPMGTDDVPCDTKSALLPPVGTEDAPRGYVATSLLACM